MNLEQESAKSGQTNERYKLVSLLGQGAHAEVFSAFDLVRGQEVVLKILKENVASNPIVLERFKYEYNSLGELTKLSHYRDGEIHSEIDYVYLK